MTDAELFSQLSQEHFVKLAALSQRTADSVLMGQSLARLEMVKIGLGPSTVARGAAAAGGVVKALTRPRGMTGIMDAAVASARNVRAQGLASQAVKELGMPRAYRAPASLIAPKAPASVVAPRPAAMPPGGGVLAAPKVPVAPPGPGPRPVSGAPVPVAGSVARAPSPPVAAPAPRGLAPGAQRLAELEGIGVEDADWIIRSGKSGKPRDLLAARARGAPGPGPESLISRLEAEAPVTATPEQGLLSRLIGKEPPPRPLAEGLAPPTPAVGEPPSLSQLMSRGGSAAPIEAGTNRGLMQAMSGTNPPTAPPAAFRVAGGEQALRQPGSFNLNQAHRDMGNLPLPGPAAGAEAPLPVLREALGKGTAPASFTGPIIDPTAGTAATQATSKGVPWLRMGLGGAIATVPLGLGLGMYGASKLLDQGTQPHVYGQGIGVGPSTY